LISKIFFNNIEIDLTILLVFFDRKYLIKEAEVIKVKCPIQR